MNGFENPFEWLANGAARVVTDTWSAIMLTIWNAGLFVLRIALKFESHLLTPDLSDGGPARDAYATTFWIAGVLALIMMMVQIGTTLARRDGKALARVAVGIAQFVLVWVAWLGYGVAVIAACGGLNDAMMKSLLGVDSWDAWQPAVRFRPGDLADGATATVLGLLGLFLWIAAIAHLLVILTRAAALIVLAATTPISAAGLMSEVGRSWFWKSFRWFHAAALTPLVMTMMMGIGNKIATGVALGLGDKTATAIGSAIPSVLMIIVSAVAPLSLFKLLAFVDPGTNSGASVRAGLAAAGGVAGVLGGRSQQGGATGDASTATDAEDRSQGEGQGEAATTQRFANAQAGLAGRLGPVGQAYGTGLRAFTNVGSLSSAIATDSTNQMGVGHNTYQPDLNRTGRPESDPDTSNDGQSGNEHPADPSSNPGGSDPIVSDPSGGPDGASPTGGSRQVGDPWSNPPGTPTGSQSGSGGNRGTGGSGEGSGGSGPKPPGGAAAGGEAGGAEAAAVVV